MTLHMIFNLFELNNCKGVFHTNKQNFQNLRESDQSIHNKAKGGKTA